MDKELLKRILAENTRVIIPNFGAFLRKQQGDSVVFSPFLKTDDGLITSIVEQEYGVSGDDAKSMVTEFVTYMRTVLATKSKYYIDDVGMLIVDSNGAISFVAEQPKPAAPVQPVVQNVAPQPTVQPIQPQRIAPQPISQPIAPQPIAPQPMRAPMPSIPQPIAQPHSSVAAPQNTGVFGRHTMPNSAPQIPSPIGGPQKPHPNQQVAGAPQGQGQGQPRRRAQQPNVRKKRNSKNDIWLIAAISAALIVVVIMVIALISTSDAPKFDL